MTMQTRDVVEFEGKHYSLISPFQLVDFRKDFRLEYRIQSTAGHGCDPVYAIRDGKLYLDELYLYLGEFADYPKINGVLPADGGTAGADVPAFTIFSSLGEKTYRNIGYHVPFSGEIFIGRDYDHKSSPTCSGPFEEFYQERYRILFEDGIVKECENLGKATEKEKEELKKKRNCMVYGEAFKEKCADIDREKDEENQKIPDEVNRKDTYRIRGKNYVFLNGIRLCGDGNVDIQYNDRVFFSGIEVPYSICGFFGNCFFPTFCYVLDDRRKAIVENMWLCLNRHVNVGKLEAGFRKPERIIGKDPRFAEFQFEELPVKDDVNGIFVFGRGGNRVSTWDFDEIVLARVKDSVLYDIEDISADIAPVREWSKKEANHFNWYSEMWDDYLLRMSKEFPDIAEKYPWWFGRETWEKFGGNEKFGPMFRERNKGVLRKVKEFFHL